MKRLMQIFLVTVVMLLVAGCSSQAGQETPTDGETSKTQSGKTETNDKGKTETKDKETSTLERPKAAEYIQSAIDYADKIAGDGLTMDDEGNFFASLGSSRKAVDQLVAFYACYGKDIKQIRRWGRDSFLILTKDGDVYHNTQLVSSGKNVVDILWKTNNVGVNAVFLLANGKCMDYWNDYEAVTKERSSDKLGIVACRWREDLMVLDAEGDYECSGRWENCEVKGWKNTVVLTRTANEDMGTATIAGISADGTVYATGDYAEDILSWGELAYISMDDKLIVGLKKDGTLAFTGELGEMYSALEPVTGVKGVRLWRGTLWAITENDVISSYYEHTSNPTINSMSENAWMKMDKEGNTYKNTRNEDGSYSWVLCDYPKADAENRNGLILYQLLLNSEKTHSFVVKDLNNDGVDEVISKDSYGGQIVYANHGYLDSIIEGYEIIGYYPNAGIAVAWDSGLGRLGGERYIRISDKKTLLSTKHMLGSNEQGETEFYEGAIVITEEKFNELLKGYIAEEEMCTIADGDFIENTEENLKKAFLK